MAVPILMTKCLFSMDRKAIIAAYERHEQAAGGIARANIRECAEAAAKECGASYEAAREVLSLHWAGSLRAG